MLSLSLSPNNLSLSAHLLVGNKTYHLPGLRIDRECLVNARLAHSQVGGTWVVTEGWVGRTRLTLSGGQTLTEQDKSCYHQPCEVYLRDIHTHQEES